MGSNSYIKPLLAGGAMAAALLGLAGCAGSNGSVAVGYAAPGPWAYNGWYDGFYGPVYDGYWGTDGFFYYRTNGDDHRWHRGDGNHFRRESPGEGGQFRPFQGSGHPDQRGTMPHFPHNGGGDHQRPWGDDHHDH